MVVCRPVGYPFGAKVYLASYGNTLLRGCLRCPDLARLSMFVLFESDEAPVKHSLGRSHRT